MEESQSKPEPNRISIDRAPFFKYYNKQSKRMWNYIDHRSLAVKRKTDRKIFTNDVFTVVLEPLGLRSVATSITTYNHNLMHEFY